MKKKIVYMFAVSPVPIVIEFPSALFYSSAHLLTSTRAFNSQIQRDRVSVDRADRVTKTQAGRFKAGLLQELK
jgi:hypothetical protein